MTPLRSSAGRLALTVLVAGLVVSAQGCRQTSPMAGPSPVANPPEAPPPVPPPPPPPAQARYRVVFESIWSAATHPTDFPDDAHYSGLIGGTHTEAVTFWRPGEEASEGIRLMAERGRKTPLDTEVMAAIDAGIAEFLLSGPALDVSPGTISMEFDVTQSFPLVTLVLMVAPSPDWFVGVAGWPLFAGGQWVDEATVDLYAYDAGTDSGETYAAPDETTDPRGTIAQIVGYPIATGGQVSRFGTFAFTRIP